MAPSRQEGPAVILAARSQQEGWQGPERGVLAWRSPSWPKGVVICRHAVPLSRPLQARQDGAPGPFPTCRSSDTFQAARRAFSGR